MDCRMRGMHAAGQKIYASCAGLGKLSSNAGNCFLFQCYISAQFHNFGTRNDLENVSTFLLLVAFIDDIHRYETLGSFFYSIIGAGRRSSGRMMTSLLIQRMNLKTLFVYFAY